MPGTTTTPRTTPTTVMQVTGAWQIQGKTELLKPGQVLPQGAKIVHAPRRAEDGKEDSIKVILLDGSLRILPDPADVLEIAQRSDDVRTLPRRQRHGRCIGTFWDTLERRGHT